MTMAMTPPASPVTRRQGTAAPPLRVLALPAFGPRANPYNRLLCEGLISAGAVLGEFNWLKGLTGRWDVAHVHWPEYTLRSRKFPLVNGLRQAANLAAFRLMKQRGMKIVWTIHNLKPHDLSADTSWRPYAQFLELVDACIYMSQDSRRLFTERYPAAAKLPGFVIPHGLYDNVYANTVSREEARRRLGIPTSATVAAAVGGVARYKNLVALVREHAELDQQDLWLVVAGRPTDAALKEELERAAAGRSNVILRLRFVPDDELQDYFAAADFCVAPYGDILNSGAVLLAISFGRPVLCPAIGSLEELRHTVGDDWVRTFKGGFDAGVLDAAVDWGRQPRNSRPDLPTMQWDRIGEQTLAAFRTVARGEPYELT